MTKTFFLQIAKFIIKINLHKTDDETMDEFIKYFVLWNSQNIVKSSRVLEYQYTLNVRSTNKYFTLKKEQAFFFRFLNIKNAKEVETWYGISPLQFSFILQYLINSLLVRTTMMYSLHCSAISYGNNAFVFLGPNFAGKSTILKLFKNHKVYSISDDTGLLQMDCNQLYYYPVSIFENKKNLDIKQKRYNLKKIFFLKKSDFFKITPINDKNIQTTIKKFISQVRNKSFSINRTANQLIKKYSNRFFTINFEKKPFSVMHEKTILH
jgi:hypothetical protein